jgi:hypothetical protein
MVAAELVQAEGQHRFAIGVDQLEQTAGLQIKLS